VAAFADSANEVMSMRRVHFERDVRYARAGERVRAAAATVGECAAATALADARCRQRHETAETTASAGCAARTERTHQVRACVYTISPSLNCA
jgi:hypothetical protein